AQPHPGHRTPSGQRISRTVWKHLASSIRAWMLTIVVGPRGEAVARSGPPAGSRLPPRGRYGNHHPGIPDEPFGIPRGFPLDWSDCLSYPLLRQNRLPVGNAMSRPTQDVTEAELAVLQSLWEHGPATIRQLVGRVYGETSGSAYATVQKLLDR